MTIFSANQIKFDKDYLNELTSEPNSGVFKQQCKYHIALHPAQFTDFGQSIKDELGRKIAAYDEVFQGIMLGYEKIKFQSELGVIGQDNCYIHMDIQALFFVFRPEIGMILKGTVTRTTKDHVGCLVYNTFNISIPKPDDDDGSWLGKNAMVKSEVEFKITYVDLNARLPHIRGELRSIILPDGVGSDNISPIKSKKKQKKKDATNAQEVPDPLSKKGNESQKKHKKKRLSGETASHTKSDIEEDSQEQTLKKKSKKKHKEKHTAELNETMETENNDTSKEADVIKKTKKKAKKDKHKKKREKSENEDFDSSLESLDLKSLFSNTSLEFDDNLSQNRTSAGSSDKRAKRKRSQSFSQEIYLDDIKMEPDSDFENIVSGKQRT